MAGSSFLRRAAWGLGRALPDATRSALLRRLGGPLGVSGAEHGLVTVVVVCEVADLPRLPETLASVGGQTHRFFEALVVPVGDADPREAVGAVQDPRFRLLPARPSWQQSANAGADAAAGDYLAFTPGCDPLPPTALHALAESLAESGSALATGRLSQRGQPEESLTRAQESAHARPGAGLAPQDRPELAGDLAVGNRLIRTEAWRAGQQAFDPDDSWLVAPTVAKLLAGSARVDVLDERVHEHSPEHGTRPYGAMPSSLPELPGWRHRADRVERALTGALLDGWLQHVCDVALPRFLKDAERATEQDWLELRRLAAAYTTRARDAALEVRAESRTLFWLAAQNRRTELHALAAESQLLDEDLRTRLRGADLVAEWESVGDAVPAEVRRLGVEESPLVAEVRRVRATPDGVGVELFARVAGLDLATVDPVLEALLEDDGWRHLDVSREPAATRWGGRRFQAAVAARVELPWGQRRVRLRLAVGELHRETTVDVPPVQGAADVAPGQPVVGEVALDGTALAVTLSSGAGPLHLVDDTDRRVGIREANRIDLRDERFGRLTWLAPGRYRVVTPAGNPAVSADLRSRLPLELVGERHRARVQIGVHGGLVVWLMPPLTDDEQGPYAQQRLLATYLSTSDSVDRELFYFESYAGRSATDSPLPIFRELRDRRPDLRACWGIADHGQWVPDGAVPVLIRSRAWYDLLASAGCLVVNTDFEPWFRRRPGQVVLQTFHGYPSKAMGQGQWEAKHYPPSQIQQMRARGVDTWSAILTPTPEMTRHYREQYAYVGVAFEHGYPRNDALRGPAAEERRAATRSLLGIADDQTAVLYAPTWRDHLATRPRGAAMSELLDIEAAVRSLGERHLLLLRGHRFHAARASTGRVVDVTTYPEINDLILAADVAVLDYSSMRFDFAITGKPMVFLVPDLEEYDAGTRGFLFPFTDSAPGPLVTDTAGVVAEVRDVPALTTRWSAELVAFNATYNPWQDGRATGRVVDGLLDLLP